MALLMGPTFNAGTAISNVLTTGNADPYFIIVPLEWIPANLSFLISPEGNNFFPMYQGGKMWEIACAPGAALALATTQWPKGIYVRFVSGFIHAPVIQPEECRFSIITS